jgi:hypothetical protein
VSSPVPAKCRDARCVDHDGVSTHRADEQTMISNTDRDL